MKDESVRLLNKSPHRKKRKKMRFLSFKEIVVILIMGTLAVAICYIISPKERVIGHNGHDGGGVIDKMVTERVMKMLDQMKYQDYPKKGYNVPDSEADGSF